MDWRDQTRAGPTPAFRPVSTQQGAGKRTTSRGQGLATKLPSSLLISRSQLSVQVTRPSRSQPSRPPPSSQDVCRKTNKRARWTTGGQAPKARRTRSCTSQCIRQQRVGADGTCLCLTRYIGDTPYLLDVGPANDWPSGPGNGTVRPFGRNLLGQVRPYRQPDRLRWHGPEYQ